MCCYVYSAKLLGFTVGSQERHISVCVPIWLLSNSYRQQQLVSLLERGNRVPYFSLNGGSMWSGFECR